MFKRSSACYISQCEYQFHCTKAMSPKSSSIQVIDRVARLLDAIARHEEPVGLKALAAGADLHSSTAFRILGALAEHGFVEKAEAGGYRLGGRLVDLGGRASARVDVRQEAREIMEALRDQVGETVNLTIREGDEVVYVERVVARRMMRVEQVIGSRAPLHLTAVGKAMLGEMSAREVRDYVKRTGMPHYTVHSIRSHSGLQKSIRVAREQGYALDNEEAEIGVGCIGVIIHDGHGSMVAGLSVSCPIERRQTAWIGLVKKAGEQISKRLGYRPAKVSGAKGCGA